MQPQERALSEYTRGKTVTFPEFGEPTMSPVVMDVGIDLKCHEHIAIKQPGHDSSSAASDRRTVSAVIGFPP
jgi:D-serine dehydratase